MHGLGIGPGCIVDRSGQEASFGYCCGSGRWWAWQTLSGSPSARLLPPKPTWEPTRNGPFIDGGIGGAWQTLSGSRLHHLVFEVGRPGSFRDTHDAELTPKVFEEPAALPEEYRDEV